MKNKIIKKKKKKKKNKKKKKKIKNNLPLGLVTTDPETS